MIRNDKYIQNYMFLQNIILKATDYSSKFIQTRSWNHNHGSSESHDLPLDFNLTKKIIIPNTDKIMWDIVFIESCNVNW